MKKKIISLLLVTIISSTALISCGKTTTPENSNEEPSTTEQSSSAEESKSTEESSSTDSSNKDSNIVGENNKPTIEVKQLATISDFKDKDKTEIEKLLGKPISEEDSKLVYEKDNYTFEVTYLNLKCNEIKIIPKTEMKYPADATNLLKLVGINASQSDTISPAGLEWDNKFDTSKITISSNNEPDGKITYVTIIFAE